MPRIGDIIGLNIGEKRDIQEHSRYGQHCMNVITRHNEGARKESGRHSVGTRKAKQQ